ncbi:TMEM175 family protein [Agriterribacter sp.]|uniref:TMEM175 family protein n=1 Tax=Agriterribacter sp. TaxID=2821509 RepID=UPI002C10E4D6|nr:TMEM175 family protein [Agriterribacter sp.]HRP58415.1 TMEM175 family protein [Agriterribacter sp.]
MHKGRLEAFSDGVIAIIITIMVLELKVPHTDNIAGLKPLWPVLMSYMLSFIYVGIYWNNHHHMLFAVEKINGTVLWANLHLLFWLSLIPFVTDWMGENHFTKWPVVLYGIVLIMNAIAYTILAAILMKREGKESKLSRAFGRDRKSKLCVLIYAVAIGSAFITTTISLMLYLLVAIIWFIPDIRIERILAGNEESE